MGGDAVSVWRYSKERGKGTFLRAYVIRVSPSLRATRPFSFREWKIRDDRRLRRACPKLQLRQKAYICSIVGVNKVLVEC